MYNTVKVAIEAEGYEFVNAELSMIPDNYMAVSDEQRAQFEKMMMFLNKMMTFKTYITIWKTRFT